MASALMIQESDSEYVIRKDAKAILILVLIAIPLFCVTPFFRELWSPDEPRYAAITREMVVTGNWLVPHLNGELYAEKPPLHFWLMALGTLLWGSCNNFVLLLPSMLAGLGCLIVTYFFGRTLFNTTVGLLSGLVLATSSLFLAMAQYLRMDMLLTFFITTALFCFYEICIRNSGRPVHYLAFYASLALATLTKGPVGVVLPLTSIVLYLALKRDIKSLLKLKPLPGVLLFALIVSPWLIATVNQAGWEYLQLLFVRQNLVRAYDSWDHDQPFYFYLPYLPAILFPWFPFIIGAFITQRTSIRQHKLDDGTLFLIIWFMSVFFLFSLMSAKVAVYLLPLIPAASLLIGKFWYDSVNRDAEVSKSFTSSGYCVWLSLIIVGIALLYGIEVKPIDLAQEPTGVLFLLSGVVGLSLWILNHKKPAFITVVAFMAVLLAHSTWRLAPIVDKESSLGTLGAEIAAIRPNQERVGMYNCDRPSLYFYTGSYVTMLKDWPGVIDFLSSDDRVLCVLEEENLKELTKRFKPVLHQVGLVESGGKRLVIVSQHKT
jgi:4-amino-4-deoxy-L-arabinose transferase-like glycosyltransferase